MTPRESWTDAQRLACLYRACATAESGSLRADLFARLAGESQAQAAIWRARLTARGEQPPPPYQPDPRTRFVAWLIQRLGPRRLRSVLSAMNLRGVAVYATSFGSEAGRTGPAGGAAIRQHAHRGEVGDLCGRVYGVNKGLLSNACLILGVAGATGDARTVLVSGVAGLAAGALAVAASDYVALRSQREFIDSQLVPGVDVPKRMPAAAAREMVLDLAVRGVQQKQPSTRSGRNADESDPARDLRVHAAPDAVPAESASPLAGAARSLLVFATGAALPLGPFLFAADMRALPFSVAIAAAALFVTGAMLSLFTGHSAWRSGARMLALGALAGGVSFGIGRVLGGVLA